ncbi:hypothetical protein CQ020_16465 [Arthrobacter sp. MYb23]|uniref:hypothetical protein n=1 Tax=unclassified Arthrobacter TaxID=235627 RepID=UPI000CFD47F3|nr:MULTISPECIES: hypothetical protein [unclassified Arthrobacter]PRB39696.1 hypothetical protein CQ038_17880 [Arthrobacter sp. MYb51]PRB93840.1 hypothetical protein CQ020_16465 [Arthrobacter sp. MYb23]
MTARSKDLAGALSADITRIFKKRYPDELARAQSAHARSEKSVLAFMFSSVALWFLGPALYLTGLIGPVLAIMVPGLLTLALLASVLVGIFRNRAASRPIVEQAQQLGYKVTSVTKKGVTVAAPKGEITVPAEFRETLRVTRQR